MNFGNEALDLITAVDVQCHRSLAAAYRLPPLSQPESRLKSDKKGVRVLDFDDSDLYITRGSSSTYSHAYRRNGDRAEKNRGTGASSTGASVPFNYSAETRP